MQNIIRPSKSQAPPEQMTCPVCGADYINEHTVFPSAYLNLAVQVYECTNQHSWEKHPGSIPPVPTGPINTSFTPTRQDPPAFQDVYRPLHDTQEPMKRLFQSQN